MERYFSLMSTHFTQGHGGTLKKIEEIVQDGEC